MSRMVLAPDELRADPWGTLARLHDQSGRVVAASAGVSNIAYLKHEAPIRALLVKHHDQFGKVNTIPLTADELAGGEDHGATGRLLMSQDRAEHLAIRRPLAADVLGAEMGSRVAAATTEIATTTLGGVEDGATIDASQLALHLAVSVVSETLFAGSPLDAAQATADITALMETERLFRDPLMQPTADFSVVVPRVLDAFERLVGCGAPVPRIVERVAAERGVSTRDAGQNVLAVYAAATETTVPAMAFSLAHLAASQRVQRWLREESDAMIGDGPLSAEHLTHLPRARAMFAETLRLYPPSWFIGRVARAPVDLDGYPLAPGEIALICLYLLHRDRDVFNRPNEFLPERFIGTKPPATYLPFGAGRRQCLGENLAWIQGTTLLAAASRYTLELIGEMPQGLPHASTQPDRGITVRIRAAS